ncbi:hypothetical protein CFAM422_005205 [Trichoderma lentiforme]|uniref:Uncharacterized protein n=1 Tax=Trichoderma lentiforme TaxID=1567552 RepID=A0A9P4XI98_9HYPO|nr:hypothetical protein CFAM422_005205 [Trichoderma lentiforme]
MHSYLKPPAYHPQSWAYEYTYQKNGFRNVPDPATPAEREEDEIGREQRESWPADSDGTEITVAWDPYCCAPTTSLPAPGFLLIRSTQLCHLNFFLLQSQPTITVTR